MTPTAFDRDTLPRALGDGEYEVSFQRRWWVYIGPNGGFTAAVVLRALTASVDDPERSPRSLTVHYLAPLAEGPARIHVQIERSGRSLTTASARIEQDGKTRALALAAFSRSWPGLEFANEPMPAVPPPEELSPFPPDAPLPEFAQQFEFRHCIGEPPFSAAREAVAGGWMRLREERPIDPPLVAALTDAYYPAVFPMLAEPTGVPTIDLTIHFRAPAERPYNHVLGVFATRESREGFVEEDGRLWARDGTLIAQSRQLALMPGGF